MQRFVCLYLNHCVELVCKGATFKDTHHTWYSLNNNHTRYKIFLRFGFYLQEKSILFTVEEKEVKWNKVKYKQRT